MIEHVFILGDKTIHATSREKNTYNIYSKDLAEKIDGAVWFRDEDHDRNFELVSRYVCENALPGDAVITLGCGDAYKIAKMILKKLAEEES